MKKFSFKLPLITIILLFLCVLLFLTGLGLTIYKLTGTVVANTITKVIYICFAVIDTLLLVVVIAVLVHGRYAIKNKKLIMYYGIFSSSCKIDDIVEINHFKKTDKLVVYFKDAKYMVILISKDKYEEFIIALRKEKPDIIYDENIEGEDIPKQ